MPDTKKLTNEMADAIVTAAQSSGFEGLSFGMFAHDLKRAIARNYGKRLTASAHRRLPEDAKGWWDKYKPADREPGHRGTLKPGDGVQQGVRSSRGVVDHIREEAVRQYTTQGRYVSLADLLKRIKSKVPSINVATARTHHSSIVRTLQVADDRGVLHVTGKPSKKRSR